MNVEKNKELCRKYPFLLPRGGYNDEVPEDYDYSYTELDSFPDGWRISFGEMMCEELAKNLNKTDNLNTFRFDDIKEKWGSIRIYHHGGNDDTDMIIEKYSHLSENICIICGKPDVYMTNRGWIYPCCKECWEKDKHHTNIPYEAFIEGDSRMEDKMKWSSYTAGDDDWVNHEVDISKTANEIRRRYKERCGNSK